MVMATTTTANGNYGHVEHAPDSQAKNANL